MDTSATTLAALLEAYSAHRPREGATLRTILRTLVLPGLGLARHDSKAPAFDGLPAAMLYGAMTRDRRRGNLSHSRRSDLFRARRAWCMLAESRPDLALAPWPAARERRGIPPLAWPEEVRLGIVDLFAREGLGTWSQQTRSGYEQRVAAYLGCLRRLGLDLPGIFAGVEDGKEALRLLFQGLPPGFPGRPVQVHAHELAHDHGYRTQLVAAMEALDGAYDGRASEANPLLVAALACLVESGNPASAAGLLTKAIAINRGFLGMTDRHTRWRTERARLLAQAMKRRPSRYAGKKRTAFQNPRLWVELVKARSKLRGHTLGLESAPSVPT